MARLLIRYSSVAILLLGLGSVAMTLFEVPSVQGIMELRVIDIDGAVYSDPQMIIKAGDLSLSTRLDRIDLDQTAVSIRRLPWIKDASVRRQLPDTLRIVVQEHQPCFLAQFKQLYHADCSGVIFKRWQPADPTLVVVSGLDGFYDLATAPSGQKPSMSPWVAPIGPEAEIRIQEAVELVRLNQTSNDEVRVDAAHWDAILGWSIVASHKEGTKRKAVTMQLGFQPMTHFEDVKKLLHRAGQQGMRARRIVVGAKGQKFFVMNDAPVVENGRAVPAE